MASKEKLLQKIRQSQKNVKFSDALKLAEMHGFVVDRIKGSHHILKHPDYDEAFLNLQDYNGEAKPYQVKQILKIIEELELEIR